MKTAILCSGVALGVYIPGLCIRRDLGKFGKISEVFVLESLFTQEKLNKLQTNKKAHHENFRIALIGQKLAHNVHDHIDADKLRKLYNYWEVAGFEHFIILSGFWLPLIENFTHNIPSARIECLHIDSATSPSWMQVNNHDYLHVWLMESDSNQIIYKLDVADISPCSFLAREHALLLHGGGWGLGTYRSVIPALLESKFHLHVSAYYESDLTVDDDRITYHFIKQGWEPWQTNQTHQYIFPQLEGDIFHSQYPGLFDITKSVKAVVSKPGGSTLLDSLESATPLVFLEAYGEHENKNSKLWEHLGFGISYPQWEKLGFDIEILESLHQNLLTMRDTYPKYIDNLMKRM